MKVDAGLGADTVPKYVPCARAPVWSHPTLGGKRDEREESRVFWLAWNQGNYPCAREVSMGADLGH